ncbi:MAG TPA: class I adenylate-forming enzyme family protein [Ignavibacteria bacterium]|nr:class I adenylate-forming enzyme family protein [Ignavibacteria bacterium]
MDDKTKLDILKAHYFINRDRTREYAATDYLVQYENICQLLKERLTEQASDEHLVFYDDKGNKTSFTYGEFISRAFQIANYLLENGIGREDRIATFSHNHSDTVILYFACCSIGAVIVPVNVSEESERVQYIFDNSNTKIVFTRDEYLPKLSLLDHSKFDTVCFNLFDYSKFSKTLELDYKFDKETESMIVYTSGTTGNPKGVVLTQYNLMVDAKYIAEWHGISKNDTMMCVLPIHHVNGTVVTIMTSMYAGARLILNQKFQTDTFLKRIADEKVKVVSVVPTLLAFMLNSDEDSKKYDLKNFSHIICGAGPLTCELAKKFEDKFGLRIVHGYGLSETTCYSCFIPANLEQDQHLKWQNDFGFPSIGLAIDCNEMDIQDDKGNSLGENEKGEIVIRGHNVMKYYFDNDEVNRKTFEFEWFRSGDEGFYKYDDLGEKYFFITGRIKELIIRGGVNISPLEIDEVLSSIDCVQSGIAVGFENDWYGEEVGALVLLKEEFKNMNDTDIKNKIMSECHSKLPYYKAPKVVVFSESIPVTSTGKYQRNKVKHLFSDFKAQQFSNKKG